nr:MAG TPA: hypothetical protein [Caudoviricetes sp.]
MAIAFNKSKQRRSSCINITIFDQFSIMVIKECCPKADNMSPVVRSYPRFPDTS